MEATVIGSVGLSLHAFKVLQLNHTSSRFLSTSEHTSLFLKLCTSVGSCLSDMCHECLRALRQRRSINSCFVSNAVKLGEECIDVCVFVYFNLQINQQPITLIFCWLKAFWGCWHNGDIYITSCEYTHCWPLLVPAEYLGSTPIRSVCSSGFVRMNNCWTWSSVRKHLLLKWLLNGCFDLEVTSESQLFKVNLWNVVTH